MGSLSLLFTPYLSRSLALLLARSLAPSLSLSVVLGPQKTDDGFFPSLAHTLSITPSLSHTLYLSLSRALALRLSRPRALALTRSRSACLHSQDGIDGGCQLAARTGNGGYKAPTGFYTCTHRHSLSRTHTRSFTLSLSRSLALALCVFTTKMAQMGALDSYCASKRTGNGGPYARCMQTHKR